MGVFRRPGSKVYHFKFLFRGVRYRGTTGQLTLEAARRFETKEKNRVREIGGGIAEHVATAGPTFQDFTELYYQHQEQRLKRADRIDDLNRVALRFWGRAPKGAERTPATPYHDLRLGDVVRDPQWLLRWEEWLALEKPVIERTRRSPRGRIVPMPRRSATVIWSSQTKNQYRSWLSGIYKLALSPSYRLQTGIITNPVAGMYRDPQRGREVALTLEDLREILAVAAPHLRLAIAIGMLAPKLREANILALEYRRHIDREYKYITIGAHKTDRWTGAPLVVPISEQLREILVDARRHSPFAVRVIRYQGKPIKDLRGAVKTAVRRAAKTRKHLRYGLLVENGVTFHSLRHTAATMLAELDVAPEKRQKAMGHRQLSTTMKYTHLRPLHEQATLETLSAAVPIADLIVHPRAKTVATPAGKRRYFMGRKKNA